MQSPKARIVFNIAAVAALFASGLYLRSTYDHSRLASMIDIIRQDKIQMKIASTEIPSSQNSAKNIELMQLYNEVYRLVKTQYVDQVSNDQEMSADSIRSMVGALNDPLSQYLSPDETKEYENHLNGIYHGICAETTVTTYKIGKTGYAEIQVVTPIDGGPADKAKIRAKDIIVEVDHKWIISHNPMDVIPTTGTLKTRLDAFDKAKKKLEDGLAISDVIKELNSSDCKYKSVTIRRGSKQIVLPIQCGTVNTPSASLVSESGRTKVIRLFSIRPDTVDMLKDMLNTGSYRHVILDIRNTTGSNIKSAQQVYGVLAGSGKIGYTKVAAKPLTALNSSSQAGVNKKLTVLIGKGTSGTAELVAAALKLNKKATLIGEATFGQPRIPELFKLDDGSSVRLITTKLFTSQKADYAGKGITPNTTLANDQNQGDLPIKLAMKPETGKVTK